MDWKRIINDLRSAGLSQEQIAEFCECGQATISELATGKTKNPTYSIGDGLQRLHRRNARRIRDKAVA